MSVVACDDGDSYSRFAVGCDVHVEVVLLKLSGYFEILLEFDLPRFKDALYFVNNRTHMNVVTALEKVGLTDGLAIVREPLNASTRRRSVGLTNQMVQHESRSELCRDLFRPLPKVRRNGFPTLC